CHEGAECVAMRGQWTNPAAIEAEIAHLRSLALDALRRHWRVIFGRTPPSDLSKDLLGRMIAYRLQERAFGGSLIHMHPRLLADTESARTPSAINLVPCAARVKKAGGATACSGWWRRHVAPARLRGVLACPSANVGARRNRKVGQGGEVRGDPGNSAISGAGAVQT